MEASSCETGSWGILMGWGGRRQLGQYIAQRLGPLQVREKQNQRRNCVYRKSTVCCSPLQVPEALWEREALSHSTARRRAGNQGDRHKEGLWKAALGQETEALEGYCPLQTEAAARAMVLGGEDLGLCWRTSKSGCWTLAGGQGWDERGDNPAQPGSYSKPIREPLEGIFFLFVLK